MSQHPIATLRLFQQNIPIHDFTLFATVDERQIDDLYEVFHNDPIVNAASSIALNDLTGGGIVFERKNRVLTEEAKRFYSDCYLRFLVDLVRSLWMYGFAPCVWERHEVYVGVPRVLDVRQLRTRVFEDITNTRHYAFFRRPQANSMFNPTKPLHTSPLIDEEPIGGVLVFETEPPDGRGRLHSKLLAVMPELRYQQLLQSFHLEATRFASNPIMVEERPEIKYDPDNLDYSIVPPESVGQINRTEHRAKLTYTEAEERGIAARYAFSLSRGESVATATAAAHLHASELGIRTLQLARNSKIGRQLAAQDLSLVLEHRAQCEELVGAMFGVPRGMFAQSTYTRAIKNEEAIIMFQRSQMSLKLKLQAFLLRIYYEIYAHHHVQELLSEAGEEDGTTEEDSASATITITGVPAPSTITNLYYEGSLKYESYVQLAASMYGIPRSFFNKEPELSLQDINGIKDQLVDSDESKTVTETEKKSRSATGQVSTTKTKQIKTTGDSATKPPKKKSKKT